MKNLSLYITFFCFIIFSCQETVNKKVVSLDNENLELINGVLNYNELPFSGTIVSNYKDLKLKMQTQYVNGKKHGEEKQWSENGVLLEERFYKKGKKTGIHKGWWGSNIAKFEYVFNNDGEYNGSVKEWYKNGQLYKLFNFKDGKEIGSQKLWKPDGTLKANYEVKDGERFGLIGLKKCYTVTIDEDEIK